MLVAGINSAEELIKGGENENCRVFDTEYGQIQPITTFSTSTSKSADEYQVRKHGHLIIHALMIQNYRKSLGLVGQDNI